MVSIISSIKRKAVISMYYAFRIFPIKRNKIYVRNFYGRGYGDSPKYIIDYLIRNHPGFDVVWCVNSNDNDFPQGVRTVKSRTLLGLVQSIYEQTTAKIWIDNATKYSFERKRKGQYYIQTWHGDIALKKIKGDALDKYSPEEIENSKYDASITDLHVCGNGWWKNRLKTMFFYDGPVLTCGLPRRDPLYSSDDAFISSIKNRLSIPNDVKILIYAPTFRDEELRNHRISDVVTSFDWQLILNKMEQRFGGKWIGLLRLHPMLARFAEDLNIPENVMNVTNYPDISELLCISDCCISDYSSTLVEFALTKKPGFIYAPDMNEYNKERGYYFTANELPFSISTSLEDLNNHVQSFDENIYLERHNLYYNETLHMYTEGHASENVTRKIIDICRK